MTLEGLEEAVILWFQPGQAARRLFKDSDTPSANNCIQEGSTSPMYFFAVSNLLELVWREVRNPIHVIWCAKCWWAPWLHFETAVFFAGRGAH